MSGVMSTPITWPLGPTWRAGQEAVEAAARAQIEHRIARLQRRQRLRVAAAEVHVGAVGHGPRRPPTAAHCVHPDRIDGAGTNNGRAPSSSGIDEP